MKVYLLVSCYFVTFAQSLVVNEMEVQADLTVCHNGKEI